MPDADSRLSPLAVAAVALVGGAIAGAGTVAATRAVVPVPAPVPVAEAPAPAPEAAPPAPLAPDATFDELREELVLAEAERSQLAGSLLALNRRAESIEERLNELADRATDVPPAVDPEGALPGGADGDVIVAGEDEAADEEGEAADALVAAGLDPQTADDIRARRNAFQLARLDLVDQAAREGWSDSERFDERLEALEATRPDLREELGDEAYDRYLFEDGGNNRVGIASVIPGSAASVAGLAAGDVVLSYAGERLFRLRELQSATRGGVRGEYVQLSVLRDGEIVAVDLPRGPLGVTLNGLRRSPG